MQVKINHVEVENIVKGRSRYSVATVSYSYKGEARQQKLMSFANPDVFKKVQELVGKTVEVELTKNDKGYTEWKSIAEAAGDSEPVSRPGVAGTTRVSGSNYETKEERAARQVLIVKQSSLSAAVEVLKHNAGKDKVDPQAVLDLAQEFTDWVFETNTPAEDANDLASMNSDIPF